PGWYVCLGRYRCERFSSGTVLSAWRAPGLEAAVVDVGVQEHPRGREQDAAVSLRSIQRVQRPALWWPEYGSDEREFRNRVEQPDQLRAHRSARRAVDLLRREGRERRERLDAAG